MVPGLKIIGLSSEMRKAMAGEAPSDDEEDEDEDEDAEDEEDSDEDGEGEEDGEEGEEGVGEALVPDGAELQEEL